MADDDYTCDICGQGGNVVGAIVFDHLGNQIYVTVHIVCENSRVGKNMRMRAKASTN